MLQCVTVCCSVLQCVANHMLQITGAKFVGPDISIEGSMLLYLLQCVTVCCSVLKCVAIHDVVVLVAAGCSELQCVTNHVHKIHGPRHFNKGRDKVALVAVCCGMLQCVAVCCSVLRCVAVLCSFTQYRAVCCSVV